MKEGRRRYRHPAPHLPESAPALRGSSLGGQEEAQAPPPSLNPPLPSGVSFGRAPKEKEREDEKVKSNRNRIGKKGVSAQRQHLNTFENFDY